MIDIKEIIENKYLKKIKASDYVGVEIEIPIINENLNHIIEEEKIQYLFRKLSKINFKPVHFDNTGNIISLKNEKGDTISLEYSYNTLEFSLNKDKNIFNHIKKFNYYYNYINKILNEFNYKLLATGINPYYKEINKNCLNEDRYKIIEKLLTNNKIPLYGQFCAYCCSIQTHINTSKDNLINTLNLFTIINKNKGKLFANSYMDETKMKNSRKYLWHNCNFGPFNIGENKVYNSSDDLINDYLNRSLFYVKRNNKFYLLKEKYLLKDYFNLDKIYIILENGKEKITKPLKRDFKYFRSYKDLELTRYGTIEIRTDCTQNLENIFKVVAFNVGIFYCSKEILEYINKNKIIDEKTLQDFAIKGLLKRNKKEEIILQGEK